MDRLLQAAKKTDSKEERPQGLRRLRRNPIREGKRPGYKAHHLFLTAIGTTESRALTLFAI
jgi:hypothetical protein